jgi:hypothetical protein
VNAIGVSAVQTSGDSAMVSVGEKVSVKVARFLATVGVLVVGALML